MEPEYRDQREWAAFAVGLGLLALVTPARVGWSYVGAAWWTPYLLWLALIGLGVWVAARDD